MEKESLPPVSEKSLSTDQITSEFSPILATMADSSPKSDGSFPSPHSETSNGQYLRDESSLFSQVDTPGNEAMDDSSALPNEAYRISPNETDTVETLDGVSPSGVTAQALSPESFNCDLSPIAVVAPESLENDFGSSDESGSSSSSSRQGEPINEPLVGTQQKNYEVEEEDYYYYDDEGGYHHRSYPPRQIDYQGPSCWLDYDSPHDEDYSHHARRHRAGFFNPFHVPHSVREHKRPWDSYCPPYWGRPRGLLMPAHEDEPTGVGAGLSNLGNTCFLNAILQCFTHTVPLVKALRSCSHSSPCSSEGFCLLCALRDHIELSLASSGKILSPSKLVDNLNYISSSFQRYQQEDAHEFLQCLLDRLERCCLDKSQNGGSSCFQDDNVVQRVFGGRLISKLRCCNCGQCSDKYEPLIDLSLEIENVDFLQQALESFTRVEKIEDPETKFTCENCKEEVSMEKQLMLDQAPSVAAFHLKRFKTDGFSVEKIRKHVEFPVKLDLKPYTNITAEVDVDLKYELFAVVVHEGFLPTSGHYFCYIRSSPETWHKLDDSMVVEYDEKFVLSQSAYILFYARDDTPWFSSLINTQKASADFGLPSTSPKSVLENAESESTSFYGAAAAAKVDNCEAVVTTDVAEKMLPGVEINETRNDVDKFPSGSRQVGLNLCCDKCRGDASVDVPIPTTSDDCNGRSFNNEKRLAVRSSSEENICNQGSNEIGRNGVHPPMRSKPPSPHAKSGGIPESRYCIPRSHLKVEKQVNGKRSPMKNSKERIEAIRLLKNMPNSRKAQLIAAILPQNDKKRKSSTCNKSSPLGSRRKLVRHVEFPR